MKIKLCIIYAFCITSLCLGNNRYNRYYGMVTSQNKRQYQEDRFTAITNNREGVVFSDGIFFGIYDGHGGDKTASFLQKHLHAMLGQSLGIENLDAIFGTGWAAHIVDPCQLLEKVFLLLENYALKNYKDGSTALTAYIDNKNRLYCAWVGDTRLVLEKNGAVGFATTDHKPDEAKELKRITDAGGKVEKWGVYRVGGLAISRSIGDVTVKKNYKGQIIALPECKEIQLNTQNHFLIMASDGLWDVMDSDEAIKIVRKQLSDQKIDFLNETKLSRSKNLDDIARSLQDIAINRGSEDNITICVVYFDWSEELSQASVIKRFWNWLWNVK